MGKTAIAVHIGHLLVDDYPDGQLYVRLRGADKRALEPRDVLADFLRALGVAGTAIPETLTERADLYRSRLWGRRILVVLDDAGSDEQVAPLLPGAPTCAVLLTSRHRLPGVAGFHRAALQVLEPAAAEDLLRLAVGEGRGAAESTAIEEVARLCGYLPLALRIAAARMALRPGLTIARFARWLRDENRRLNELQLAHAEVRAAIALSYDVLSPEDQRAFRMLGLLEAADFTSWRLAALLDIEVGGADRLVESLLLAGLVDSLSTDALGEERFQLHDLLRVFARERLEATEDEGERMAALRRAAGSFLHLALLAASALEPGETFSSLADSATLRTLEDPELEQLIQEKPAAWFAVERPSLVIAIDRAASLGLHTVVIALSRALFTFFDYHSQWDDWRRTATLALESARQSQDRSAEAAVLRSLGRLERYRGNRNVAATLNQQSLDVARAGTDELAMAETLVDEIRLNWYRSRYAEAHEAYDRAIELFTRHPGRYGRARCDASLGLVLREEGRYTAAVRCCDRALEDFRKIGDTRWIAATLTTLADLKHDLGDDDAAKLCIVEALSLLRSLGFRWWEAVAMGTLGEIYRALQCPAEAELCLTQGADVLHELSMQWWEAVLLLRLADLHAAQGRYQEAHVALTAAAEEFATRGDRRWTAISTVVQTSIEFGSASSALDAGRLAQATAVLREYRDNVWTVRALTLSATLRRSAEQEAEADEDEKEAARLEQERQALALEHEVPVGAHREEDRYGGPTANAGHRPDLGHVL